MGIWVRAAPSPRPLSSVCVKCALSCPAPARTAYALLSDMAARPEWDYFYRDGVALGGTADAAEPVAFEATLRPLLQWSTVSTSSRGLGLYPLRN